MKIKYLRGRLVLVLCFCFFLANFMWADGEWEWQNPLPQGNDLIGLWGSSPDDIWTGGWTGTVVHYDGSSWNPEWLSGTSENIHTFWGTSAANIWMTAGGGEMWHFDGSSWTLDTILPGAGLALWGLNEDDIWTASTNIYHYDGSMWSQYSNPTADYIFDIWGPHPDTLLAVAHPPLPEDGSILKYDGNEWTEIVGTPEALYELHGTSGSDIWFVGWNNYILHWDGDSLVQMTPPVFDCWWSVYCIAPDDVWIGGSEGDIIHWNGTSFEHYVSPLVAQVSKLWASASDDVWGVGTGRGSIIHWNGTSWKAISHDALPDISDLRDIWAADLSNIWVVGGIGFPPGVGGIGYYDGNSWTQSTISYSGQFDGIWGTSASDIWVVGWAGQILHYDGVSWNTEPPVVTDDLLAIWGNSYDDIWAVGIDGIITHYNGVLWSAFTRVANHLGAVLGFASDDVWTCGSDGAIYRFDGASWTQLTSPTAYDLHGISGSSSQDIWMCGIAGTVIHYDGSAWQIRSVPTPASLYGILKESDASVWVVGYNWGTFRSEMWHYDGATWTQQQTPRTTGIFHNITQPDPEHIWVIGGHGAIFHRYSGSGIAEYDGPHHKPEDFHLSVYPNPFTTSTTIRFSGLAHRAEGIELEIFDAAGRLVKNFILYPSSFILPAKLEWDGSDDEGRKVTPGIYFARLSSGKNSHIKKI
ncbi:T9SS type A sorting domain-containing protein, partial [candidate division WOR-3 bacterium]|nr:T9SS type A sorting domain-containing protein [candidate division WOR-3 bacterium]